MLRTAAKLLLLGGLVVAGSVSLYVLERHNAADARLEREQQKSAELRAIADRLQAERRVADVIVTDQSEVNGVLLTTLLFVEYARDGVTPLPAKRLVVD